MYLGIVMKCIIGRNSIHSSQKSEAVYLANGESSLPLPTTVSPLSSVHNQNIL